MELTEILDEDLAGVGDGLLIDDTGLAVLQRLLGAGVEETDAVRVGEASSLRDGDLDLLDGGLAGDVNGPRELLQRLLRCYISSVSCFLTSIELARACVDIHRLVNLRLVRLAMAIRLLGVKTTKQQNERRRETAAFIPVRKMLLLRPVSSV